MPIGNCTDRQTVDGFSPSSTEERTVAGPKDHPHAGAHSSQPVEEKSSDRDDADGKNRGRYSRDDYDTHSGASLESIVLQYRAVVQRFTF